MEQHIFKQIISQLADIKQERSVQGGPRPRPKKSVRMEENEWGEMIEVESFELDTNHTLPLEIKQLKPITKTCELACGRQVANQVIERKFIHTPQPHWRTYCRACHGYVHPKDKSIIKGSFRVNHIFATYFAERDK
jgi:hypothetical protein